MKLAIIGTGYVGLVTGACFADLGNDVICLDIDQDKIDALNRGEMPIYEPGLADLVSRNRAEGRLRFSVETGAAVSSSEVVFICVGTPQREGGKADLSAILAVADNIGEAIQDYTVVVTKSTVPVGSWKRIERQIRGKTDVEFDVVSNPEFLKEGGAIIDFQNPDRIVIGTNSKRARQIMQRLYSPHARVNRPIVSVKPQTAELIKYAANGMLASRISFMNALTGLCEKLDADIKEVANGMGLDDRIGPRFLQASPGYGGSCFPKDVRALVDTLENHGLNAQLFRAIDQVNEQHKKSHLARVQKFVPELSGERIALWGLSFKPRTDDIRESPSLTLIEQLLEEGAHVSAYDPEAEENTRKVFPNIDYCKTPYDAVEAASAVVVMTEWDVFRTIDLRRVRELMAQPVIIDCRNVYRLPELVELGFRCSGMGIAT